jgi:hypothetical protein
MQMSRYQVFVFAEGKENDSFFVGGICERAFGPTKHSYKVNTARDLSHNGGGKQILLRFYRYLRSRGDLHSTLNGKRTDVLFFLDKDVDDLARRTCRSKNVIYTKYYDVESHLFRDADFSRAVACACSISPNAILGHPRLGAGWCADVANRWRVWVALCVFCQLQRIGCQNYGALSEINTPRNGPIDKAKYRESLKKIYRQTGRSWQEFDSLWKAAKRTVEKLYAKGEADRVFKGKWYAHMLELDLRADEQFRNAKIQEVAKRIPSCLAATLDFDADWAQGFADALRQVIE